MFDITLSSAVVCGFAGFGGLWVEWMDVQLAGRWVRVSSADVTDVFAETLWALDGPVLWLVSSFTFCTEAFSASERRPAQPFINTESDFQFRVRTTYGLLFKPISYCVSFETQLINMIKLCC